MDPRLPPDQQAVLDLLVTQRRSYAEIASLLGLEPAAVRRRAHAAVATVAGGPPATEELADHVLGQQEPAERRATARRLRGSDTDREWVDRAAEELGVDAPAPAPQRTPAPARRASRRSLPRPRGLALPTGRPLLAAGAVVLVAAVVALVVVLTGSDGSSETAASPTPTPTPQVQPEAQVILEAPGDATSPSGALVFGRIGTDRQIVAMQAQGLRPTTSSTSYALWLQPTEGDPVPVAFLPAVEEGGQLTFQAELQEPVGLAGYRRVFVTREPTPADGQPAPTTPGDRVLSGSIGAPTAG